MTINPGYQRFHTPCYVLYVRAFHCNNHINSFSHLPSASHVQHANPIFIAENL